jgi:hypothetical protein
MIMPVKWVCQWQWWWIKMTYGGVLDSHVDQVHGVFLTVRFMVLQKVKAILDLGNC